MSVYFFTSVSLNYIPKARALALSVKEFHPDARFCLLLAEPIPAGLTIAFPEFDEIVSIDDLSISKKEAWLFKHSVVEACTALKGFFLEMLLNREDCQSVLYLDPDIVVFSSLSSVLRRFDQSSILLTPHSLDPENSSEGIFDNEISILRYGLYNLGFIGVKNSPEGKRFSSWWKDRLTDYCYSDLSAALFTDQRWVDLVPSFFDQVEIIRDPACNVATWNINKRIVGGSAPNALTVNGSPLIFYHFSGFDSGAQQRMVDKYGKTMPTLTKLREWYRERCRDLDNLKFSDMPWRYDSFDNGQKIKPGHRLIYRMRKDLEDAFPNPFAASSSNKTFYGWINNNPDDLAVLPSGKDQVDVFSSKLRKKLSLITLLHTKINGAIGQNKLLQTANSNLNALVSNLASNKILADQKLFLRLLRSEEKVFQLRKQIKERDRQLASLTYSRSWKLFTIFRKLEDRCDRTGSTSSLRWLTTLQIFRKLREYKVVRKAFEQGELFDRNYYCAQLSSPAQPSFDAAFHYVFLGVTQQGINPSPLFDTEYYLKNNADVELSQINPLSHFFIAGAKELRQPCRLFDPRYYLSHNSISPEGQQNPLLHFIKIGAEKGFKPSALFDSTYYLEANPKLDQLPANSLAHFILCGAAEGRKPHPLFDTAYYLKNNPTLRESKQNALEHFLEVGSKLGNKPHPLFDTKYYAEQNSDFDPDKMTALEHFLSSPPEALTNPNPLFDCAFYLATYEDVRLSGVNPLIHYLMVGASEGRKPHPLFDTGYYTRTYPDIVEAKLNPLAHFLDNGGKEKRRPHLLFDTDYYLRSNPDVAADGINPLVHFLQIGALQNRHPHLLFDIQYYQSQIQDPSALSLNPLVHFMSYGAKQGLNPHPLFDNQYYLTENPELAGSKQIPYMHFLEMGIKECRNPNPYFDAVYYLREYADVFHGKLNPFSHFLLKGDKEGRNASPWFDANYYREQNPEVKRLGVNSLAHFIAVGLAEGRKPIPNFDPDYYAEQYPDVVKSGLNPLLHFIRIGSSQGRIAVPPQCGTQPPYASVAKLPPLKASLPMAPPDASWAQLANRMAERASRNAPIIDVIIPVYRGFDVTLACIYSALSAPVNVEHQIIVINDCSPELQLVSRLRELAGLGLFTLVDNESNLGFVGSVNKGMTLHPDRDVVLLNSDAIVYGNWLDRLYSASRSEEKLGTLTPFTNNDPTICTYPRFNAENNIQLELDYSELDSITARVNADQLVDIPTAVGFCMYIRRDCLNDVGLFDDQAFGRGNGEENDFSQRALNKGWKNKLAANVFVRHIGAVSFLGEKSDLVKQSAVILKQRYPDFFTNIKSFFKADPILPFRRKIDIARLRRLDDRPAILFVTHDRGGGTERHMRDLIGHWRERNFQTLIMRSDKRIPDLVHITQPDVPETPNLSIKGFSQDLPETIALLEALNVCHLHVHHLAGFSHTAPNQIQEIAQSLAIDYDFTIHDYTPICPQINLIDSSGTYCGEPEIKTCQACVTSMGSPFGIVDVNEWRQRYGRLLSKARLVFVPNSDVSVRLSKYFPAVRFAVRPHSEESFDTSQTPFAQVNYKPQSPMKVAILGALGPHKGSKIFLDCATDALKRKLPLQFVLFGYANNEVELRQLTNVTVTGPYDDAAIFELIEEQRCHVSFFPAVWPETFSYTLSIAMKANLYPVAFDFGAISERLKKLGWGELLELSLMDRPDKINDRLLAIKPVPLDTVPHSSWQALYPNSLSDYYGSNLVGKSDAGLTPSLMVKV
jgi:O-antigen biosynthesis protein